MCLETDQLEVIIAQEDVYVYKMVIKTKEGYLSPFQFMPIILNELTGTMAERLIPFRGFVEEGLHGYTNLEYAKCKCQGYNEHLFIEGSVNTSWYL